MNNARFPTKSDRILRSISGLYSTTAHWIVIAVGIALRVAQFLYNRSLTEGEAALALNIIERSYVDLLKPLDYFQAAPVGFLMMQRFVVNVLGTTEYALRLLPLGAGIMGLLLFYHCAKAILTKEAIPIALILYSVGDHLIYFSSEVKQYSSDVLIVLIILAVCCAIWRSRQTLYYLAFGLTGAVALWFSHPALFVFIAGGMVLLVSEIRHKQWRAVILLCCGGVVAGASLWANYLLSLAQLSRVSVLLDTWHKSFAPFPPASLQDLYWYPFVLVRMFIFPVGFSHYELLLGIISCIVGIFCLYRSERRTLIVFIISIVVTLCASAIRLYPFEGRLLLFLTPVIILLIAQGIAYIQLKASAWSMMVGITLVLILLIHPVVRAGYHIVKPRAPEELRPVLQYVDKNYRAGDAVYVYYASCNAYRYYAHRFGYDHDYTVGTESREEWSRYYYELKRLRGNQRVWIVMSHIATAHGVDEEKLFVSYLNMLGEQKDAFPASGAAAYLYDLSDQALQPNRSYSP